MCRDESTLLGPLGPVQGPCRLSAISDRRRAPTCPGTVSSVCDPSRAWAYLVVVYVPSTLRHVWELCFRRRTCLPCVVVVATGVRNVCTTPPSSCVCVCALCVCTCVRVCVLGYRRVKGRSGLSWDLEIGEEPRRHHPPDGPHYRGLFWVRVQEGKGRDRGDTVPFGVPRQSPWSRRVSVRLVSGSVCPCRTPAVLRTLPVRVNVSAASPGAASSCLVGVRLPVLSRYSLSQSAGPGALGVDVGVLPVGPHLPP